VYKAAVASLMALALCAVCSAARPLGFADPLVALDFAKSQFTEGRIADALDLLAAVPQPAPDEAYISEEVLLQELLGEFALLSATHNILLQLERDKQGDSAYATWLAGERATQAAALQGFTQAYLDATAGGARLDFLRFSLPRVTEAHVQDTELYSDVSIVGAAVTNWAEGREGLGRGLITTQARVALVLAAAVHSDLPQAAAKLEQVTARLKRGVPLKQEKLLSWLESSLSGMALSGDGLAEMAQAVGQRLNEIQGKPAPAEQVAPADTPQPDKPARPFRIHRQDENNSAAEASGQS